LSDRETSGDVKVAPHLTEENAEQVLAQTAGQSKRQIEEIVARLSPAPDRPASIRPVAPQSPTAPDLFAAAASARQSGWL
jgi:hypothetical protein